MGYAKRKTNSGAAGGAVSSASQTPQTSQASQTSSGSLWNMEFGSKQKTDMKSVEVLLFTSELADLIEAGMTLGQALQALANQGEADSAQRYVCRDLCDRIVRGESFSDACAHHPKTFEPLYSNMIRAGEASGAMVEVLRRLVDHYERFDNMRGKIKSALSYPIVVICVGIAAIIGALVWIIPKFQKVFDSLGATLPLPTRILMGMSEFTVQYGWILLGLAVMFFFWFNDYAAGLSYYYLVSLFMTILQTMIFRWSIDDEKLLKEMEQKAKKKAGKPKSGLMARLEKMQQEQLHMAREQAKANQRR